MSSWIGANVWIMLKTPNDTWSKGIVLVASHDDFSKQWTFQVQLVEDTGVHAIKTVSIDAFDLEFEWIKRREVGSVEFSKISDMTALTYLNEPEIIECLRRRYEIDLLYTATGPILIAVNPYKYLPIYGEDVLEKYFKEGAARGSPSFSLPPHVFQISDNAYRRMFIDKFNPDKRENQSILVNGESGAGKTESTKHCLHYLAVVSSKVASCLGLDSDSGDIENKIIASNPITESLGNAKTSRNNNSSRFGKYIQLGYSADGVIENAAISTYLLESVRVVSHVQGERNFHIFYEIVASLPEEDLQQMGFTAVHDFKYLHNGEEAGDPTEEEHAMDVENYTTFRDALDTMDIPLGVQESLICVVMAVLHIGNLSFVESDTAGEEAAFFSPEAEENHVKYICQLLGISEISLLSAVGRRSMSVAGSTTVKQLSVHDAMHAKDNFARTIYTCLFTWMLASVNEVLNTLAEEDVVSHIGILDIFGFEFFETNSFEQLCINYTNEKLQDHFNNSIFRTEQELYRNEGIQWIFVDYPDNSSRLDLLENKKHGIFAQCDERLKLKAAVSHEVLAKDLYSKCSNSPFFIAEAQHQRKYQFVMKHFAGDVLYSTELFLEKNRSEVAPELTNCLKDSRSAFVRQLADTYDQMEEVLNYRVPSVRLSSPMKGVHGIGMDSERRLSPRKQPTSSFFKTPVKSGSVTFQADLESPRADSDTSTRSPGYSRSACTGLGSATRGAIQVGVSPKLAPVRRKRLHTVLSQFTKQLQELMDSVKTTRSHFIRCIKPNVLMCPNSYDCGLVMAQLRCGGVHGAVQVFRAGFPNRFDFSHFVTKYSSFAFVCGQNMVTRDFYNLRRRATATEHDAYWRAACTSLLTIVPMADAILSILGIRAGLSSDAGDAPNVDVVDVQAIIASTSSRGDDTVALLREGMCMGKSQVFMRAPAFEYLEQLQLRASTLVVQLVQRHWRAFKAVSSTMQKRPGMKRRTHSSINRIALAVDEFGDKKRQTAIRITSAVIVIQRRARVFLAARRLRRAIFLSVWVSSHYRGYKAREGVRELKWHSAAVIQSVWRGKLQKARYLSMKSSAVFVQNWVRRVRHRLLLRKEMRLRVQAQWSTLKLQSLWRRKSARRATMSLVIVREEERRQRVANEERRRQDMMDRLLDKFEQHPGLMDALLRGDDALNILIRSQVAKVDKATSTVEVRQTLGGEGGVHDSDLVGNPLLSVQLVESTSAYDEQHHLQQLKDKIVQLERELQKKKTCCFGFC